MQIGIASGICTAGIGDDDFELRIFLARIFYAPKQNRVGIRGVAARDEQTVGMHDIVVASRGRVCT